MKVFPICRDNNNDEKINKHRNIAGVSSRTSIESIKVNAVLKWRKRVCRHLSSAAVISLTLRRPQTSRSASLLFLNSENVEFQIRCFISKSKRLTLDWVENRDQISHFLLPPIKIRGRYAKCLSPWFHNRDPIFSRGPLHAGIRRVYTFSRHNYINLLFTKNG